MYTELRERCDFQQRHYHEELERKDRELADVRRELKELREERRQQELTEKLQVSA